MVPDTVANDDRSIANQPEVVKTETVWGDTVYTLQDPHQVAEDETILAVSIEQHAERQEWGVFVGELNAHDEYDIGRLKAKATSEKTAEKLAHRILYEASDEESDVVPDGAKSPGKTDYASVRDLFDDNLEGEGDSA